MKNQFSKRWWRKISLKPNVKESVAPKPAWGTKNRASKKWLASLEKHFVLESIFICSTLFLHPAGKACKQDIVLYQSDSAALSAGEVWLHTQIDEKVWTLVSPLALESYPPATCSALWSKTTDTMLLKK